MSLGSPLRRSFFEQDARVVAEALLGCRIAHRVAAGDRRVLRITEVEAYLGDGTDPSAHSHNGQTPRNRTMFGPPGRLYAYQSYGIHVCVNVVCGSPGSAAAVLLRAAEPLEGMAAMRRDRGLSEGASPFQIARGPGRLTQALGLQLEHNGTNLLRGALTLHSPTPTTPPARIATGPRVGITRATDLPYRFFEKESPWVSPFRPGKSRKPRTPK